MRFKIIHRTEYAYTNAVTLCYNEAHLQPRPCAEQIGESSTLHITPWPAHLHERVDYFGNPCTYFAVQQSHQNLIVEATSLVQVKRAPAPAAPSWMAWDQVRNRLLAENLDAFIEARQLVLDSPFVALSAELADYAAPSFQSGRPLLEAAGELCSRIYRDFVYDSSFSTLATPLIEVLQQRRGVCQDFAHLAIGCLRSMGVPARYVSGYIETMPPPGQQRLRGSDGSHAWFSVFDPLHGWVDLDPTNNQIAGDHHVVTAWGRDYSDVTPLKGIVFGGGTHTMTVSVDTIRLDDEPDDGNRGSASAPS